jgi:nucleoside phosphorylase
LGPSSDIKIGVIIPTTYEAKIVGGSIKSKFKNMNVVVSGMGKIRAALAARGLLDKGCNLILLSGFCGGVRGLDIGDVVFASEVLEGDFDSKGLENGGSDDIHYHKHLCHKEIEGFGTIRLAPFVCQDRLLTKDEYKLRIKGEVLATDMESYGVLTALSGTETLACVMKVVSDVVSKKSADDFLNSVDRLAPVLNVAVMKTISRMMEG